MINYSASPFAIPAVEATSVIYLKPTNSRGIKSQTHYGFAFPFECLRAPGVYKIEVGKFSKKKVIFTFSGGSSAPKRALCLAWRLENRYQVADEDVRCNRFSVRLHLRLHLAHLNSVLRQSVIFMTCVLPFNQDRLIAFMLLSCCYFDFAVSVTEQLLSLIKPFQHDCFFVQNFHIAVRCNVGIITYIKIKTGMRPRKMFWRPGRHVNLI